MFPRLFAESGLSLDRLRSLVEVGAAGSIAKAADGDPVRQSQYSRQIKELEDFFSVRLIERHGKGVRFTPNGKELARISRFFLLGLSNFQRGCRAEQQTFQIGASATFIRRFLLPVLSDSRIIEGNTRYVTEIANDHEIERRLHDLTLDFGVTHSATISRPLQTRELGKWSLRLLVPKALHRTEASAARAFKERRLPLVLAKSELDMLGLADLKDYEPRLVCDSFFEAMLAMEGHGVATVVPDFLVIAQTSKAFLQVPMPPIDLHICNFYLAWNPRLLRLNPHATRKRDFLAESLARRLAAIRAVGGQIPIY
jgi:DNA-binding transcriptional LysR family regulator